MKGFIFRQFQLKTGSFDDRSGITDPTAWLLLSGKKQVAMSYEVPNK